MYNNVKEVAKQPALLAPILGFINPATAVPLLAAGIFVYAVIKIFENDKKEPLPPPPAIAKPIAPPPVTITVTPHKQAVVTATPRPVTPPGLLGAIQEFFLRNGTDRIFTADLLAELNKNNPKPLNPRQLAQQLACYGIKPKVIRIGHMVQRGFIRDWFSGVTPLPQRSSP